MRVGGSAEGAPQLIAQRAPMQRIFKNRRATFPPGFRTRRGRALAKPLIPHEIARRALASTRSKSVLFLGPFSSPMAPSDLTTAADLDALRRRIAELERENEALARRAARTAEAEAARHV